MANREFWVADCETDPFKEGREIIEPFIWGAYNGSEYREFKTVEQFIEFMREFPGVVYAHNGGKFDWFFILDYIDPFSDVMIINGRLAKFKIGECEFRDSYNILPIPLREFNKDDFDYSLLERDVRYIPANYKKIQAYLKSDCVNLWQLVNSFRERFGEGLTLAGSAMKVWQKMSKRKAPKTSADFYDIFSNYYYGGRVEVFRSGIIEEKFSVIDINSAYPHAMKHLHAYGADYDILDNLPDTDNYISRCFIKIRCQSLGAFPYREKTGLSFPSDKSVRTFMVTGWEFLSARDTDTLSDYEILSVISFKDSIEFGDYVDRFYEEKNNSEKGTPGYIFAKLFLNSLYGKFAANPDKYKEFTICPLRYVDAAESDGYQFACILGDNALLQRDLQDEKQRYLNVATAASITGFVRAMLWRAICASTDPIYCDTDSLAAGSFGEGIDLDSSRLGAWDVEAVCDYGAVAGKKLYAFRDIETGKWKKASKGARLEAEEIISVAKGVPVVYTPIAPTFSLKNGIKIISRKITKNVVIGEK